MQKKKINKYLRFKIQIKFQVQLRFEIKCLNISDIAIITVKSVDYCCIIHVISKSEAIHLLENYVLEDRGYM